MSADLEGSDLDLLVFLGTERDSTPPRPARLGHRVALSCFAQLAGCGAEVTLIDPLEVPLASPFKPHFSYARGKAPEELETLAGQIEAADGYVMVSPEYNHAMSPSLAHLLNHFGASLFAYKPSLIVTYSAGQWGGARAAVNLRTFLGELGCLPVSAMVHVPAAQTVFDEEGDFAEDIDAEDWKGYMGRGFGQLRWWADAARRQRQRPDAPAAPGAFQRAPSQRNSP